MIVFGVFGILMMIFSGIMIINPGYWCNVIIRFSQLKYFHPFEIISRLLFGCAFLLTAEQTAYPELGSALGYLLLLVGAGLLFISPAQHRRFALWSAEKFLHIFRPAGFITLIFGAFLVYAAIQGS